MWICMEIQTEDLTVWHEVDRMLSAELGFTHIVWGVLVKKDNKPVPCKLPSNLFHVVTSEKESDLRDHIVRVLKPLNLNYNVMVIGSAWSQTDETATVTPKYEEDKEIITREA